MKAPRVRRSCLSVPGSQERFHLKAEQSAADQVFFDLEDSVAPGAKAQARTLVVRALNAYRFDGKVRSVRVNSCETPWCFEDIIAVIEGAGDRVDSLVIPKVEGEDHVHFVATLLDQIERKMALPHPVGLELQIESARGMENIGEIAAASTRAEALIFGPADFMVSLRAPELTVGRINDEYPGDYWHYFLARLVVAARANGLQPIDGPYGQIRDLEGLRTSARRAAMLGFEGKWALHPGQIAVLNEVFAPSQEDFDKACAILAAYEASTGVDQVGALMLGDEMIDEASRKLAAVMVDRGRGLGMKARTWRPSLTERAGA